MSANQVGFNGLLTKKKYIDKAVAMPVQTPNHFLEKNAAVVARLRAGERFSKVASELGVCTQALRRTVYIFSRLEANAKSPDPLYLLSVRASNCLRASGIDSIEKARDAIGNGDICRVPNLGAKSLVEIKAWLTKLEVAA